jgi:hypothetical protein
VGELVENFRVISFLFDGLDLDWLGGDQKSIKKIQKQ